MQKNFRTDEHSTLHIVQKAKKPFVAVTSIVLPVLLPVKQHRFLSDHLSSATLGPVSSRMGVCADVMLRHPDKAAGFCRNVVGATVMLARVCAE